MTSAKYRRYACFGIGPTRSTSATRRLVAKNNVGEQRPADHGPLAVADNRQIAGADDLSEFVEDRLAIWWVPPEDDAGDPEITDPPPPVGDGWERDDGPGEDDEAAVKIEAPVPAPNEIETKVKPMVQRPAYVEPPPRETTFYTRHRQRRRVEGGSLRARLVGGAGARAQWPSAMSASSCASYTRRRPAANLRDTNLRDGLSIWVSSSILVA